MAIEEGIVIKSKSNKVLIEAEPINACEGCRSRKQCIMTTDGKKRQIWVNSNIELKTGDHVEFKIEEKVILFSSVLIYFFPILFLFLGSILGFYYNEKLGLTNDISAAIVGIIFFILSFLIINFISKLVKSKNLFYPTITRKINKN